MKIRSVLVFAFALLAATAGNSQVSTGTPPFSSLAGSSADVINLGNLNVHLAIPVLHKSGRGLPFRYDISFDNSVWTASTVNGVLQWQPAPNWGWRGQTEITTGYISFNSSSVSCYYYTGNPPIKMLGSLHITMSNFAYHDPWGVTHRFVGTANSWTGNGNGGCTLGQNTTISNAVATDNSGYVLNGYGITTKAGKIFTPPLNQQNGTGSAQDANGNEVTVNSSGQFFDTLSSTTPVLSVSPAAPPTATTLTYSAPSGGNASVMHPLKLDTEGLDFS